uniref:DRBM domain-containing protein n=1 Tax=Cannabis sativa TaxID=3483 RepID=A0A803R8W1_CANSA
MAQPPPPALAPVPASASASAPAPDVSACFPTLPAVPRVSTSSQQLMHKNRLQEFTHKSYIPLPVYQTINEGYQHMPKFRSTVIVNGDTVFCKSILNECATKMNMKMPTYNTIKPEGLLPVFISTLVFNDVSYTGSVGKNKKEAEQLAARAAILSLLDVEGDSGMRKVLYDIIKSKVKLYAALNKVDASLLMNKVQSSGAGVEIALPVTNAPTISNSIVGVATATLPNLLSGNDLIKHNFNIVKSGTSLEATIPLTSQGVNLPIEFVHSEVANFENVTARTSKKRRKNKKKANKRLCTSAQIHMASSPLNQGPPCSVAQ